MKKLLILILFSFSFSFLSFSINRNQDVSKLLENIVLPDGFKIEIYASDVENARSMSISPSGTIFVGNRRGDNVFALRDTNGDKVVDKKYLISDKLTNMPNGVAYYNGDLYVAEVNKVWVLKDIEIKIDDADKYGEYL